jgi:hypothetical protein
VLIAAITETAATPAVIGIIKQRRTAGTVVKIKPDRDRNRSKEGEWGPEHKQGDAKGIRVETGRG